MTWLARVTAWGANSNLMISYLGYFAPGIRVGTARAATLALIAALLTAVNIRGVRQSARLGDALAAAKLVPMILFVVVGFFFLDRRLVNLAALPNYGGFTQVIVLHIYAFTGFEFAAIPAGEAVAPKRHLPSAMLGALALAAFLYTGIQIVCLGTLPNL